MMRGAGTLELRDAAGASGLTSGASLRTILSPTQTPTSTAPTTSIVNSIRVSNFILTLFTSRGPVKESEVT